MVNAYAVVSVLVHGRTRIKQPHNKMLVVIASFLLL